MSNSEFRTSFQALEVLGLILPVVAAPVAVYVPAMRTGNLVSTPGQFLFVDGELTHIGHVGAEVTAEEAREATRTCVLNALATVDAEVSLDSVIRIVKAVGFVNSAARSTGQPGIINGASEPFGDVFGERGQHARSAMGVSQLPLDAPVEVEITAEVV